MKTVCIYEGSSHFMALSAKELLESEGIMVIMPTEFTGGVYPQYSLISGGDRLFVREDEAEKAREILSGFEGKAEPLEEPFYTDHRTCPLCGSPKYTEFIEERRGLTGSLFLLFGIFVPAKKRSFQCRSCGHTWK